VLAVWLTGLLRRSGFAIPAERTHLEVMTTSQTAGASAKSVRLIHASLVAGTTLFAIVTYFLLRPSMANAGDFTPGVVRTLLGVAVGMCALALFFRRLVPRKSANESTDLFWSRATRLAFSTWQLSTGAGLLAVIAYLRSGDVTALAIAAIAVLFLLTMNPRSFERR
jgi:hypothetical protein